jgi:DUF4097 and DUF4098 domain-containing protein YvlB
MKLLGMAAAVIIMAATGYGQTQEGDKVTVALTDPSRPAFVKAGLISGGITVKAYGGKEILVEATLRDKDDDENGDKDDQEEMERQAKRKGMHRIPNTSTGLSIEEEDNRVSISTGGITASRTIDLVIQVPARTSLKLNTVNNGDISVSGVTGDLELSNINGKIDCSQINGSVVADAINGGIAVTFTGINADKSMSFSSLNGDIDVTFPPSLKATVKMKNEEGAIYSDFDIKMNAGSTTLEDNAKGKRGRYKVSVEKVMSGTIGGGGPEMSFKNFNGDILIRKGK